MSFPIAGSAVSFAINLQSARDCAGSPIGALRLTNQQASRIIGGDILRWNDAALRTGGQNAGLANCNVPIVRVVRQDRSGTTQIMKNYLARADSLRTGATCDSGRRWGVQPGGGSVATDMNLDPQNRAWPNSPDAGGVLPSVAATATCSAINRSASNGTPALLTLLNSTAGGVGYADLADVVVAPFNGLLRPELRNGTNTGFVGPATGQNANCQFNGLSLPGGGDPALAVGLDPSDSWAYDQIGNHADPTLTGTSFPACGLTFALVFTGLSDTTSAPDAISRMTANQRRTLYGYFTYVLSSLGQDKLANIFYAPLPTPWLTTLRTGYQDNF
jgi:hypothetical protein